LTAGEPADAPHIVKALEYLRQFDPGQLDSVYSVSLQTMVFAAATPTSNGSRPRRSSRATMSPGPALGATSRRRPGTAITRTASMPCSVSTPRPRPA
jgi:hypothetical protein